LGGSGYEKPQSGWRPLCDFSPPHFFAPVKMLRIFPLSGLPKRRKQPKRYMQLNPKILGKIVTPPSLSAKKYFTKNL
jgi:hypothetical protein